MNAAGTYSIQLAGAVLLSGLLGSSSVRAEPSSPAAPDKPASEASATAEASGVAAEEAQSAAPKLKVGVGLRSGLLFDPGRGAEPTLRADDQLNVRPYLSGELNRYVSFEANFDIIRVTESGANLADQFHVLDAVVKFTIDELFQVWAGRFLHPSCRANLSGPYFQNAWNYPLEVHGFPNNYAGRDDGVAVWGQVGGGRFKYMAGLFDLEPGVELDSSRAAARMVVNAWDPEPGYYNSSTYYGAKDILALAATVQAARNEAAGDFLGFEVDALVEKNFGARGVATFESAYFNFERVERAPGSSFYLLGSYLWPRAIAIGRLQPMARWEHMNRFCATQPGGCGLDTFDVGLNYIIDGHNGRLSLVYRRMRGADDGDSATIEQADTVQLGVQVQIL